MSLKFEPVTLKLDALLNIWPPGLGPGFLVVESVMLISLSLLSVISVGKHNQMAAAPYYDPEKFLPEEMF